MHLPGGLSQRYNNLVMELFPLRYVLHQVFLVHNNHDRLPMDISTQQFSDRLSENGIVALEGAFVEEADQLKRHYIDPVPVSGVDATLRTRFDHANSSSTGVTRSVMVSFKDPAAQSVILDDRVCRLLYNYYGRQFFFRDLPQIERYEYVEDRHEESDTRLFHIDRGLRQVSLMLLLNDLNLDDTHLLYAIRSHKRTLPREASPNARFDTHSEDIERRYEQFHAIGKRGTLFIFDAGNGFHKAVFKSGSTRSVLFINVHTGWYSTLDRETYPDEVLDAVKERPSFVRRSVSKLIA